MKRTAETLDLAREKRLNTFQVIPTRAQEAVRMSMPQNPLKRGHEIMDRLRACCDSFDTETQYRSYNQILIQSRLSGGIARLVYGPDMFKYEHEIKRYNNFSTIRQESATTMPRRSGKSASIGRWVASAMMTIPGFDGACFSNSARAAGKEKGMLGIVYSCLVDHFKIDPKEFTIDNKECVQFVVNGDKRTFHSYPGACHTLRGVGGNFILVEESSYVTNLAFRELIIPLMALSSVCFVALSTLGEKTSGWFNKLIDSGLVDAMVVRYVCEACIAKGIHKPCIHCVDSLPHWSSDDRVSLMQKMYGEENKATYMREVMGIVEDANDALCFSSRLVKEVRAAPPEVFHRPVKEIFVTIDPVAGSEFSEKRASDFAIVAIASPYTTIMGMEALDIVDTTGYRGTLEKFCHRLRDDEMTQDATLIFDVEMGTGFTAPDVYGFVREKFNNIITINDKERKEGTLTTFKSKQEMMELTRNILEAGEIRFWKKFVTSNENPEIIKEEWSIQMCAYSRLFVPGNTVSSHNKYVLTGKGVDKTMKDDLCLTFQRALRTRWRYETDPTIRPKRWGM